MNAGTTSTSPEETAPPVAPEPTAGGTWTDKDYKPPEGRAGNLTPVQQQALDKLRKELKELEGGKYYAEGRMDDAFFLRFLRARKWDVEKAKQMILECENWRAGFAGVGVDEHMKVFNFKEKTEVDKYYPQFYHKTDKDGRPVYIERLGFLNVTELKKITTQERQIQELVYEYEKFERERLPSCERAVGHPVETSCTILDLKNVGLKAFWDVKGYIQEASAIGQNYYPERMGKFYIVNSPWMFSTVWSVIKNWLDPVTVSKISIPSGDGRKELLQQIPAENLPADLGGSCKCPGGCSLSDAGPWNVENAEHGSA